MRYIAFLRGINLGGHNVKMDRLRVLFEELGLGDVTTFIASGNVIFDSDERDADTLADRIEAHLAQALGYDVPTFLRTDVELARVGRQAWAHGRDESAAGPHVDQPPFDDHVAQEQVVHASGASGPSLHGWRSVRGVAAAPRTDRAASPVPALIRRDHRDESTPVRERSPFRR